MYELTERQCKKVKDKLAEIFKSQEKKWYSLNFKNGHKNKKEVKVYPTEFQSILIKLLDGQSFDKETSLFILLNLESENYVVSSLS